MLNKIIYNSLKNRLLVILMAILLLVGGVYVSSDMEVDVFPDLTAPTVAILVDAHGLIPEEVELQVAYPIETIMNGATNVRRVRSNSSKGMCIVWVDFDWGMDIFQARQIVNEQLSVIRTKLPHNIEMPIIAPQTSIMGEIMLVTVSSDSINMRQLRNIADKQVQLRLLAVSGVAQVIAIGGEIQQYQIQLNPLKMKYFGVSMDDVLSACQELNENASGGFINEYSLEYTINTFVRTTDTTELANSVIKTIDNKPVRLSDIANVCVASAQKIGDGFLNGNPAIVLTILKQPNTNTIELTANIDKAISELQTALPQNVVVNSHIFRQSDFIQNSIHNVLRVIIEGGVFAVIILFFFLLNYRTTLISTISIPLSLFASILVLKALGLTLNTMSLGGMAIAVGVLVDDAIVDVENVLKRLKQNYKLPENERKTVFEVVYKASVEIRASIFQATLIIIVAFTPLFFLTGMEGLLLRPLGITFIVSLFASLVVALTVTPVLSSFLLTSHSQLIRPIHGGNKFVEKMNFRYEKSLIKVFNFKYILISGAAILFVVSLFIFSSFGRSFLPHFKEGTLTITTIAMPGISLEEANILNEQVDIELLKITEVLNVCRRTGRAELNEHSHGGSNASEIDVPYEIEDRSEEEFLADVRNRLSKIKGLSINLGQPIGHRIDHMLSGTRAEIAIKLFGNDLSLMYSTANDIKNEIEKIEGIADLNVEQLIEIPQIKIIPKREMLAKYGIKIADFNRFVEVAWGGLKVSEVYENNQSYDLIVRYDESFRDAFDKIGNSLIDTPFGTQIPLALVAEVVSTKGPNSINRENVQRKIVVSANTHSRDVRSIVEEIKKLIDEKIMLPENFYIEYGGQFENEEKASKMLMFSSLFAVLIIFLLLYQEFRKLSTAAIILLNLPLALIGGIFAVLFSSGVISIPVIIGFITLFGIATRNGILLISRYKGLQNEGVTLYDSVIKGSADRLNPILMTALTAAFALLPLVFRGHEAGNEIQSPMAAVIIGGLITSTLLNIYIIPVIYYLIEKRNTEKFVKINNAVFL